MEYDREKILREMDEDLQRKLQESRRVAIRNKAKSLRKYYGRIYGKKNKSLIDKKVYTKLYFLYGFRRGEFDLE